MGGNVTDYGQQQFEYLGQTMPAKAVNCALDETFPAGNCLVGIEVGYNFILLDRFANKRDCETWHEAMKDPLSGLPMTVIQVVSDEAKALLKYTRDILQAHHSPDGFPCAARYHQSHYSQAESRREACSRGFAASQYAASSHGRH